MEVSFDDFIQALHQEVTFHLDGSTRWRQSVSTMAFVVASEIRTLESFKIREDAVKAVTNLFPTVSAELALDIGKMLYTIYKDLDFKLNMTDEVK